MAGTSKQNQRQSRHRAPRYAAQKDVTPINKAITVAQHIARFGDVKQKGVLRAMPKVTLAQAARKLLERYVRSGVVQNMDHHGPRAVLLELAR